MSDKTIPPAVNGQWPPLHDTIWRAVWSNDLSKLQAMLEDGADISQLADSHDSTHTTVLHSAVQGNTELLDLLLDHGAQELLEETCGPGEEGRWSGHTALQMAAKLGRRAVARRLVSVGAKYDIFSAAALGDVSHVTQLIDNDETRLTSRDDYQATPLHWSAAQDQHETSDFLIKRGLDVDLPDSFAETPLLVASERRSAHSAVTQTALGRGVFLSLSSITDLLIDHGAKIDVMAAAALGHSAELQRLLEGDRALATLKNSHGTTPLHWAARNGHVESVHLLLEYDASIDAQDNIGCTPLWYAAYWSKDAEMTHFLCRQGADVNLRNVWGKDINAYDCGYGCHCIITGHRE